MIGNMKSLQTLSFYFGYNEEYIVLPNCVWHIKTLRLVVATVPSEMPLSTKLTNLQMVKMNIYQSSETEFPHLHNLRSLELDYHSSSWGPLVAFLGTLEHLTFLDLTCSPILLDMRGFPFYQHLQTLILYDNQDEESTPNEMAIIDVSMFPPHLTYLNITNLKINQDVMSVLEKLPCLKKLHLQQFTNRKLSCSAKGFNQLEHLVLWDLTLLEEWEIEEGAMPILRELTTYECRRLCVPQGLRHLTNLQTLNWWKSGCGGEEGEILNFLKDVVPSNV